MPFRALTTLIRSAAVACLLAATATAQETATPAEGAGPVADGPRTVQEAVMWWTRSGDRSFVDPNGASVHMSADVTYAHPTFFTVGGQSVPDGVADGSELVFFLTENIHFGDLPEEPTLFRLYVDGLGPFEPTEAALVTADPHHRTHRLVYRAAPRADGTLASLVDDATSTLALSAVGGTRPLVLSWNLQADYAGVPTLNLSSADVVRVHATSEGFTPATITLTVGRPVILAFDNPTDREHHFHVMDLPIGDTMRWLVAVDGFEMSDDALRAAAQFDDHICTGSICPTGTWVHLHANPGGQDAIAFVPQETGTFSVSCPLHPEVTSTVVVGRGGHEHH